ncbi:unnamed protein product [Phaedon cochleariae]|uniref:Uncharacterized protein n=1 Tax=Phaedon cochleariae TaxID=80249 RepID=A0A9N9SN14_PHACE|nr:unnamed protein product [Phaedon cochleariae]
MDETPRLLQKSYEEKARNKKWTGSFENEKMEIRRRNVILTTVYARERYIIHTCTNLTEVTDDDDENEQNIDACTENNDDREDDDENDNRSNDKDDDTNDDVDNDAVDNDTSNVENEKTKRQSKINRNIITKVRRNIAKKPQAQSETASAVVVKYLLEKKQLMPR